MLGAMLVLALAAPPAQAYIRLWTRATASGPATGEQPYGAAVFQNRIWAKHGDRLVSSSDGAHWITVLERGPEGIDYDRLLAFNNKLWLLGGHHYTSLDGIHWTTVTATHPFAFEASFAVHNGKLWWQGYGLGSDTGLWNSNDGITWTRINATAPCLKRYGASLVSFAGKLWLVGGYDYTENKNDIWTSSDGITWQQVVSELPMPFRKNPAVAVFENKLWLMGGAIPIGNTEQPLNDVWWSSDGKNWTQVNQAAPWDARTRASTVVYGNQLWIMGGTKANALLFDVWSMAQLATGRPAFAPISNQNTREGASLTGPQPVLTAGSLPITWTLPQAPAGMTVNPQTGVIQWPRPTAAGSPHTVTLRAVNSAGLASASFQVAVNPLRPVLSAPAWVGDGLSRLSWTAVPGITGYTIQRDDAPDFATPVATTTVTSKTLHATFAGLTPGQTAWYRVRGNRIDGFANAWSNTVWVTLDAQRPSGTVKINNGATSVPALWVTLNFQATDPGANPSGVVAYHLSTDGGTWSAWAPYAPAVKYIFSAAQAPATLRIYVQFKDRAGNISPLASATTTLNTQPICVDAAATASSLVTYGTPERPLARINDALRSAVPGKDIYVAQGRYPEQGYLTLKSRMKLLGGFPRNAFNLARRNPEIYVTTVTVIQTGVTPALPLCVTIDSVSTATLDGFRIDGTHRSNAGNIPGIMCSNINRSCRIVNCTVTKFMGYIPFMNNNWEAYYGGIICNNASPVIRDCTIERNSFNSGGGVYLTNKSAPVIENCLIRDNQAVVGYARGPFGSTVTIGGNGGGIYCDTGAAPIIRNGLIYSNNAPKNRYGITGVASGGAIQNCTLFNNGIGLNGCLGQIRNCIVAWNDKGEITASAMPAYSLIRGWSGGGTGNISGDPQFVSAAGRDFHLKPTSPCIDAGGMIAGLYTDLDGTPRGITGYAGARGDGSHFDMGAYEYWLPAPVIAPATGVYSGRLTITMTGPAGATIRYTLDGTLPTENTPPYTGPINWPGQTLQRLTVTARAFKAGLSPSAICVRYYIFR